MPSERAGAGTDSAGRVDSARREIQADKTLKLRTLDKLIALVAEDIGAVLAAVRVGVERTA